MSTPRDPRCFLWDALRAADRVQGFVQGKTYDAFIADDLIRSAVERQLQIIGEALPQLARVDPATAGKLAELRRIIAFRDVLVHGYAAIDYATVWRLIGNRLPELRADLRSQLDAPEPPASRSQGGFARPNPPAAEVTVSSSLNPSYALARSPRSSHPTSIEGNALSVHSSSPAAQGL